MKPVVLPAALFVLFATPTGTFVVATDLRALPPDGLVVVMVVAATAAVSMIVMMILGLVRLLGFLLCLGHSL